MKNLIFYLSILLVIFTGGTGVFGLTSNDTSFIIYHKVSYNGGMKVVEITLEVRPGKSTITRETYLRSGDTQETASMVLTQKDISYDEIKNLFASLSFTEKPIHAGTSDSPVKREVVSEYAFYINGKQQYPAKSTIQSGSYRRLLELFHKYENSLTR